MAEGHTILRWAHKLEDLVGQRLEAVDAPVRWRDRASRLVGERVASIETHGKHLLVETSAGMTVHCHAMMVGSWQFGRPGMRLSKPERQVRLRLRTEESEAVFFNGPVVELLSEHERRNHPRLRALGPDLLKPDFAREEAWRRIERQGDREIGDSILDQTLVAGIGNIFKCEGLFLARIDPRRKSRSVSREELERLWDELIPQMGAASRTWGPVMTLPAELRRGGERNWVYWRGGRPCLLCGTRIATTRQGDLNRVTFWCAECQRSL